MYIIRNSEETHKKNWWSDAEIVYKMLKVKYPDHKVTLIKRQATHDKIILVYTP